MFIWLAKNHEIILLRKFCTTNYPDRYFSTMIRKRYGTKKLEKIECEICECKKKEFLHIHHIIPRGDKRSSNNLQNLACICLQCHTLTHLGEITIVGRYQTTSGSKLMWFYKGNEPPIPEEHWKVHPDNNPLLIRKKKT